MTTHDLSIWQKPWGLCKVIRLQCAVAQLGSGQGSAGIRVSSGHASTHPAKQEVLRRKPDDLTTDDSETMVNETIDLTTEIYWVSMVNDNLRERACCEKLRLPGWLIQSDSDRWWCSWWCFRRFGHIKLQLEPIDDVCGLWIMVCTLRVPHRPSMVPTWRMSWPHPKAMMMTAIARKLVAMVKDTWGILGLFGSIHSEWHRSSIRRVWEVAVNSWWPVSWSMVGTLVG